MFGLFRRKKDATKPYRLYGEIVAQSRNEAFYLHFGVDDTVDGRFDMIVLHCFCFLERLTREEESQREIGQEVFDIFFKDMDRSLREQGVGDLSVPKKIKKMAQAFYGRIDAYRPAVEADDVDELAAALKRNFNTEGSGNLAALPLAHYVMGVMDALNGLSYDALIAGELPWPDPVHYRADDDATTKDEG